MVVKVGITSGAIGVCLSSERVCLFRPGPTLREGGASASIAISTQRVDGTAALGTEVETPFLGSITCTLLQAGIESLYPLASHYWGDSYAAHALVGFQAWRD